ncbi:hypothetical protein [Candidatus Thiosymbion oneisti]|uniref:hypothetical protein n=1 Tax=Candidatus Thiosymbion oneisti TaxID=589554 RepID=UPI00105C7530|nr:hypothetical protein [Candidatus Thiosymbion oneisti]
MDTLTQRKEEYLFENFCRQLAQKEICPNLIPQTGPIGGGDSKVDSETYPVAERVAERWYVGEPDRAARERWAFAFSAKKDWRPKIADDVRKIAQTERGYARIYFITNQAVSDRNRADIEDKLSKEWKIPVRLLDRSWIVDKVVRNSRWDLVVQTLDLEQPPAQSHSLPGPMDAERLLELDNLDRKIADPTQYPDLDYQLAEDCLQTALLARGLGRPREEIDGRFARAERIARKGHGDRQLFRVLYHKAWTANWWFDDFDEVDHLYGIAEPLVLETGTVWELEKLVNLWLVGHSWLRAEPHRSSDSHWSDRTTRLQNALLRHAMNPSALTSALWARTQLSFLDLHTACMEKGELREILGRLRAIIGEAEHRLDYPMETVTKIILELGKVANDDDAYDELVENVIQLQEKRASRAAQGEMRLTCGFQKLEAGKPYAAIDQLAKAQSLLAQEETEGKFLRAVVGTALGYEAAGLLWAARANLIIALDRVLSGFVKDGQISPQSLPLLRKLIWVELQIGRAPCVLVWIEQLWMIAGTLDLDEGDRQALESEYELMDAVLGILVLRTRFSDWPALDHMPGLMDRLSLFMARAAALFSLGHEDQVRSEYGLGDEDLQRFFSLWLVQPAASDVSDEAEWHLGSVVKMHTNILGCQIELSAANNNLSIFLAEAILSFLESFLSTAMIMERVYCSKPFLKIHVKPSEYAQAPLGLRVDEDDCGERRILITHPTLAVHEIVQHSRYQDALSELLAATIKLLHTTFSDGSLEQLFRDHRAQDRASLCAQSPQSLSNVLGSSPRYHVADWLDDTLTERIELTRSIPWIPDRDVKPEGDTPPPSIKHSQRPADIFDSSRLKHSDLQVLSPIDQEMWDRAGWCGTGFMLLPGDPRIPELVLLFKDADAGVKIFRGWMKQLGNIDRNERIGVTLIQGIDRRNPAHYRVAIGVNEKHLESERFGPGQQMVIVFRLNDMASADDTNLSRFLELYRKSGRYRLLPGLMGSGYPVPIGGNLSIEKRRLRIVPAWKIGLDDPVCGALQGIDEPYIPEGETAAPILEVLKRFRSS